MKYLVIGLVILALLLAAAIGAVSLLENRAGQIVQERRLAEQALHPPGAGRRLPAQYEAPLR